MKTKNKKTIMSSRKYLILGVFVFVLFFVLNSHTAFGVGPIVTLTATPSSVVYNHTSFIEWESVGAISCDSGGHGEGPTGNFTTSPLVSNTTFTVSCIAPNDQTATKSVLVTVTGSPPPGQPFVEVFANGSHGGTSIPYGGTALINWISSDSNYCYSPSGGGNGLIGNFTTPSLTSNTTYTVSCTNDHFCFTDIDTGPSYGAICSAIKTEGACTGTILIPGNPSQNCEWLPRSSPLTGQNSATVTVLPPISGTITNVFTEDATDITDISANLWGNMNPGGVADAYFRYSTVAPDTVTPIFCNDIYGSDMKSTNEVTPKITGNTSQEVNTTLNNLTPNTKYYYCMVGSNKYQIEAYGGVKSFTTLLPSGEAPFITTENALVANETSTYLNATYNTTVPVKIWFEYRKKIYLNYSQQITSSAPKNFFALIKNGLENFFGINKVIAAANTTIISWIKVGEITRNANTSGKISYLLEGLTHGTSYEFRAGIKDNSTTGVSYGTSYGDNKLFTTKGSTGTIPGGDGLPYTDPCADPTDVNCNGSGGPGIIDTGSDLPDLIAGAITPTSAIVGVSTAFSSVIRNQGKNSTAYTPVINNNIAPANGGPAVSFWNNLLGINKALAAVATTTQNQNIVPTTAKGSFYNFFQISNVNPTSVINNIAPANGGAAVSFLDNLFGIKKASAAVATVNNTLINLAPIFVPALGAKSSTTITQNYSFNYPGTYYMRACADKKFPADMGLIKESYENNNCGPWTKIVIGYTSVLCADTTASNYGLPASCVYNTNLCMNPSALNYKGSLPCAWDYGTGLCMDSAALNKGGSLPCIWNYGDGTGGGGGTGSGNGTGTINPSNLVIGQIATPPDLAIVRYHEGIETVLARQIVADTVLAKTYGYQDGANLQNFAWTLADLLARTFGYVNSSGKEIRVSRPDIAAYQLYMNNGVLTVYEYYDSKIVNIQKMTDVLRNKYYYEYYFKK